MSISFRLNLLIVAVSALGLGLLVAAMVLNAGPRIHAENDSTMRLAKEFVETTIESLQGTSDPAARLKVLLEGLKGVRHVRIFLYGEDTPEAADGDAGADANSGVPRGLAWLVSPSPSTQIPVVVNGHDYGTLVIAPRSADEAAEIWDSIVNFTLGGAALAIAAVLLMSLTIARLLNPIKDVGNALMELDQGHYTVIVPEGGPPEIADICRKLNHLAATLESTLSENKRLAQRVIRVQDEERKDLARELHDEFGPYLFAIRAAVSALKVDLERGGSDRGKLLQTCDTLVEHVETIQRMNRSVLQKLRPIGLEEYGLKAKLNSLLALLRDSHPKLEIDLFVDDDLPECDETSTLTIYRLVQEGLTNAFRHSDATEIEIAITRFVAEPDAPAESPVRPVVHVSVADNGRGLQQDAKPSYGIAGMNERVWASGGTMRLTNRPGGGVTLDAWVPVPANVAERTDAIAG